MLFVGGAIVGAAVFGGAEVSPEATVLQLEPQDPSLAGTVTAAFTPGERGIYLQGSGLEPLPQDQVYELWVIEGETPAAAVCVRAGEDGSVFAFADIAGRAERGAGRHGRAVLVLGRPDHATDLGRAGHLDVTVVLGCSEPASI